jgi:antirestriction protein ArdC
MDRKGIAKQFIYALRDGKAPWRYPHNRLPAFEPVFGPFFRGEPRSVAEADYAEVEAMTGAVGVRLKHHWNCRKPRYFRDEDRIVLPPKSYFQDEAHYQATRLHEVFHAVEHRMGWTGPAHAAELVAEAATGMILSELRLPHDADNSNVNKWVAWWTMEITWDTEYLFTALGQAERAVNYLLNLRQKEAA